jgi:hypothetical protein
VAVVRGEEGAAVSAKPSALVEMTAQPSPSRVGEVPAPLVLKVPLSAGQLEVMVQSLNRLAEQIQIFSGGEEAVE